MKSVDVKWSTYIDSSKEINDKDPKFKVGDTVRISKHKNFLQKALFYIGLKKLFWLKKVKNTVPWTMLLVILKANKLLDRFTKNNYKKQIKKSL